MSSKRITILAVAILMMAAFVGVSIVGDDTDAEGTTYPVTLDDTADFTAVVPSVPAFTNSSLGNTLTVGADGKISGTVAQAPAGYVTALWGAANTAKHIIVFTITVPVGQYVVWEASDASGLKSEQAGADGKITIVSAVKETDAGFTFVVATTDLATVVGGSDVYAAMPKQAIVYDLTLLGEQIDVRYTVGNITYVQTSIAGQPYSLVALDALGASVPDGSRFVGWSDGSNTYPVGTNLTLSSSSSYTAIFEALPEIVVTFIDGTSKVAECNVTELSVKVPEMSKLGYTFTGWYLNGVAVDPLTYVFTESATLVAVWEPIKCYVTFYVGDSVYQRQTVEYNDYATVPAAPSGYTGWDFDPTVPVTEDMTVYAIPAPAPAPSGLDDPVILTAAIIAGLLVLLGAAALIWALKNGKVVIGKGPNAKKKDEKKAEQDAPEGPDGGQQ